MSRLDREGCILIVPGGAPGRLRQTRPAVGALILGIAPSRLTHPLSRRVATNGTGTLVASNGRILGRLSLSTPMRVGGWLATAIVVIARGGLFAL